jgi:hypothetical protein
LIDEILTHTKIDIIGEKIHFQLKIGSEDPSSKFYLGQDSQENLNSSLVNDSTSCDERTRLLEEYHELSLEERRCTMILANIKKKRESCRIALNQLQEPMELNEGTEISPNLAGSVLFLVSILGVVL